MDLATFTDRLQPPTAELLAAREAYVALWLNSDAEVAAGVTVETPEFQRLNRAADEALAGRGWLFGQRALSGAYALYGRRTAGRA